MIAAAIFALIFGTVLAGLIQSNFRTSWIATDAAASKIAEQRLEQTQNARWDPTLVPALDEVVSSNFPLTTVELDNNGGFGNALVATSTVQITSIPNTVNPQYKAVRSQVTWSLFGRGPFTNTAVTLRAPDQ